MRARNCSIPYLSLIQISRTQRIVGLFYLPCTNHTSAAGAQFLHWLHVINMLKGKTVNKGNKKDGRGSKDKKWEMNKWKPKKGEFQQRLKTCDGWTCVLQWANPPQMTKKAKPHELVYWVPFCFLSDYQRNRFAVPPFHPREWEQPQDYTQEFWVNFIALSGFLLTNPSNWIPVAVLQSSSSKGCHCFFTSKGKENTCFVIAVDKDHRVLGAIMALVPICLQLYVLVIQNKKR